MATNLTIFTGESGETVEAVFTTIGGAVLFANQDSQALEPYDANNAADYPVAATEDPDGSGTYRVAVPSWLPAGDYLAKWTQDGDPVGVLGFSWDGQGVITPLNLRIVVSPLAGYAGPTPPGICFEAFQHTTPTLSIAVTDADGNPVDLSALDLLAVFEVGYECCKPVEAFRVEAEDIAITGEDNNIASITLTLTQTATARKLRFRLVAIGPGQAVAPLVAGEITIQPAAPIL